MYSIKTTEINKSVYQIYIDIPYDPRHLHKLINREDLVPYAASSPISGADKDFGWYFRNKLKIPTFDDLTVLKESLDTTIKKFINVDYKFESNFSRDDPGFWTDRHVDTQAAKIIGKIYLDKTHQDKVATKFYHNRNDSDCYFMTKTNIGHGWITYNHEQLWHEGENCSNKPSYSYGFLFS